MKNYRKALLALTLLATTALVGCGGGGGGDGDTAQMNVDYISGIYAGIVHNDVTGLDYDTVGLVYDGNVYFVVPSEGELSAGRVTSLTSNSFKAYMDTYVTDGTGYVDTADVTGTWLAENWIKGSYSYRNLAITGDVDLTISPTWVRPATNLAISGIYVGQDAFGDTVTLTIQADGDVFGQDTLGCTYNGTVTPAQPDRNIYRSNITVANCGNFDGVFTGYMSLGDDQAQNDLLLYILTNADWLAYGFLNRQ